MQKRATWALLALFLLFQMGAAGARETKGPAANEAHSAGPKLILVIRHAEKPEGPNGEKTTDPDLSPKGYQRAEALARVIPAGVAKPDFLFATKRSKHSNRPVETITPLAQALHLSINDEFKDDDFAQLSKLVLDDPKYENKIVLICWHHGKIPQLVHALGGAKAPDSWKASVFDRVWEIAYDRGGGIFSDVPEKALPGDSQN